MKHLKDIVLFESDNHLFYNHWGKVFTMKEFVEHFVDELGLFTEIEIGTWMDKYGITDDSDVCWVSSDTRPNKNAGMSVNSYNRSNDVPETDIGDVMVDGEDGRIVPEASDGHNSYLFVIKNDERPD